ncbi:MAG: hypothetical protein ACLRW4_02645 [Ruminococcus sp.]
MQEFLLEMLNVNPDPTILESYIEELNNRITELKTNTDIIGNYSELVADTQVLTVLVKNYVFWVKETSENDSEINTMLGELGKEIQIPDPDSQTFNEQYASWEETWQNRINCLENLIQELPQFFESQKKELKNTVINTELLSEYNANEKMSILDELRRSKVSDINVIEKVCSLLFGKYRGIAWFSLGLAVFLIYLHCWLDFLFMDFQRKRLRIREVEMQKTFEFGNTEEGFETIAKIFFEQLTQELEKAYNDHIK